MFLEFHNLTIQGKAKLPSLPFLDIKEKILGKKYAVSLNFVSENEIKKLNNEYRNINKATDILSFEIGDDVGEIFICIKEAERKLPAFNMNIADYLKLLFIHGLLHLRGLEHGREMDKEEIKYRNYFQIETN